MTWMIKVISRLKWDAKLNLLKQPMFDKFQNVGSFLNLLKIVYLIPEKRYFIKSFDISNNFFRLDIWLEIILFWIEIWLNLYKYCSQKDWNWYSVPWWCYSNLFPRAFPTGGIMMLTYLTPLVGKWHSSGRTIPADLRVASSLSFNQDCLHCSSSRILMALYWVTLNPIGQIFMWWRGVVMW